MYCIKVKLKGFNYYTDYMERYFEKVAVVHRYHLTKRREQAEYWCLTFTGKPGTNNNWITFISDAFNGMTYERLAELSRSIAVCFKSMSVIEPIDVELEEIVQMMTAHLEGKCSFPTTDKHFDKLFKYGLPNVWLFSREFSAFDEPPFLTHGETILRVVSNPSHCISGENFLIDIQNYGGISKGLIINISFDYNPVYEMELENPIMILPAPKGDLHIQRFPLGMEQSIANGKSIYHVELPDFNIPEGVNIYSAKLCGKKKQDETDMRSFSFMFIPHGKKELLMSMQVEIVPVEYPSSKAVLKASDLKQ